MMIHVRNMKDSAQPCQNKTVSKNKNRNKISEGCRIQDQHTKSAVFLHTKNDHMDTDTKNTICHWQLLKK